MIEEYQPTLEEQSNARYSLVQSAKLAKRDGYSPEIWKTHPDIQKLRLKYQLKSDILEHIVAWVWTFQKK